jgi:hypothetical protein
MKAPSLTIDRKNKTITAVMALETARPSKATGKTMLIASTRGLRTSAETYARRPVYFTANVLYYPAKPTNTDGAQREISREIEDEDEDIFESPRKRRAKRNEPDQEPELRSSLSDRATRRKLIEIPKKK